MYALIFDTTPLATGKNVENWMLELEGMMRISIRDVMGQAILDYTQTKRPKWMQKWAGEWGQFV